MDLRPSQKIAKAFGMPCHQRCCRADITVRYFSHNGQSRGVRRYPLRD